LNQSARNVHPPLGPELLLEMWLAHAENGVDDAEVMRRFNVSKNTAASVRYSRDRFPDRREKLEERLRNGDIISLNQLQAEAGFVMPNRGRRKGRGAAAVAGVKLSKDGREISQVAYGKGDPWELVSEPMRRYLRGWESREFKFRHINHKEASQRVTLIDILIEGLCKAREDLAARSHKSSYAAPPNRRGRSST